MMRKDVTVKEESKVKTEARKLHEWNEIGKERK